MRRRREICLETRRRPTGVQTVVALSRRGVTKAGPRRYLCRVTSRTPINKTSVTINRFHPTTIFLLVDETGRR